MDAKAQKYQQLWAPSAPKLQDVRELFRQIRVRAVDEPLPQLEVMDVTRAASRMKAKAGMGIDMVTPTDYQRLPVEGQAELLLILEAVEA
eukprot:6873700-Pyramimonas_sp.AAC.1